MTADTPLPKSMKVGDTTYFIEAVLRQLDREVSEVYGFAEPQKNTRRMVENLFRSLAAAEARNAELVGLLKEWRARADDAMDLNFVIVAKRTDAALSAPQPTEDRRE